MAQRHPEVTADVPSGRILRTVLMKPEHEAWLDALHERVEAHAQRAMGAVGQPPPG